MNRIEPDVEADSAVWDAVPDAQAVILRALDAAAAGCGRRLVAGAGVSVMLTDDSRMRDINRDWRKQDKPTNVLSFPAVTPDALGKARFLGDIAIAFETARRESEDEGKAFAAHLAHLTVHGFLHLVGEDHETPEQAEAMEARETAILATLGLPDPYADTVPAEAVAVRAAS